MDALNAKKEQVREGQESPDTMKNPKGVRVRIAPSPTGPLHLGTARTALFNYLFAKHHGGTFILRVEDTDRERSDPAFEVDITESLRWLGILWDEGVEVGGAFGPYRQSERLNEYRRYLRELLDRGEAYYCFCSEEELEEMREIQRRRGEAPRYQGKCRSIPPDEAKGRVEEGERAVIRFRMPEHELRYEDLIRGEIVFDGRLLGDIAIAKGLDAPLYNFAAVIDDAEMAITHVLRGEDHIANTPKQIAIANALNLPSPLYGHFPLILGPDRTKLSKRHGATSVRELRHAGYFPEAVVNFLAMLGWNPGTQEELFTIDELIAQFDLSRIQKGAAVWNEEKLEWFNRKFLTLPSARWLTHDAVPNDLLLRAREIAKSQRWQIEDEELSHALPLLLERMSLHDLDRAMKEEYRYLFEKPEVSSEMLQWKEMTNDEIVASLRRSLEILETIPTQDWSRDRLERDLLTAAEAFMPAHPSPKGGTSSRPTVDRGRLLWPLRVALSGKKQSPSPAEIASVIGKEETLERIRSAIGKIET
jgi:nondiscriminating glutamyl-tRNA synthetase